MICASKPQPLNQWMEWLLLLWFVLWVFIWSSGCRAFVATMGGGESEFVQELRQTYSPAPISKSLKVWLLLQLRKSAALPLSWLAVFWAMSASDLSSLKWEANGEMSAQDTWDLVTRLVKVEEQKKASSLLQLSLKHSHSKNRSSQPDH